MSNSKITRRRLLAGTSAAILAGQLMDPALARPRFRRGGTSSGGSTTGVLNGTSALTFSANANSIPPTTDGRSMTFVNTSASPTPTDVPILVPMWFPPGAVPAGSIAVPQVGGLDQTYNLGNRVEPWGDGSECGGVFFVSLANSIPAGGTVQITFDVRAGSYSNVSSVDTDTIAAETNFNLQLSNCHTAVVSYLSNGEYASFSVEISGGQVTGAKVRFMQTDSTATASVTQADGGSGATLSFTNKIPTITNPGSGYTMLNGTGLVSVYLNDILAGLTADGNYTNGRRINWYARGNACDACAVYYAVPNVPHFWLVFYIERWKKANGTLLDYKAYVEFGTGLVDSVNYMRNLTFDLDWRNGTSIIVGANGGDTRFQTITNYLVESSKTLTDTGKPYWLNNHAAFTAIEQQRTPAEALYLRSTGMTIPVIKNLVPPSVPPVTEAVFEYGGGMSQGIQNILKYEPFANGGWRIPLTSGSSYLGEPSMHPIHQLLWLNLYNGNVTDARKWMRNQRVAAANSTILAVTGSGIYEPTTMHVPNAIPASAQVFSGMTPTRENTNSSVMAEGGFNYGYPEPMVGFGSISAAILTVSHVANYISGAYIYEGEMHQLNAVMHASTSITFGLNPNMRSIRVGGEDFHGCYFGQATWNIRHPMKKSKFDIYASCVAPPMYADGEVNQETAMIRYYTQRHYELLMTLVPYVGTFWGGLDQLPYVKSYDLSGSGVIPEASVVIEANGVEVSTLFMQCYGFEPVCHGAWRHQGTALGDALAAWRDHHAIAMMGVFGSSGTSHIQGMEYRRRDAHGPFPSPPQNMSDPFLPSHPTPCAYNASSSEGGNNYPLVNFTSGSSDVTINGGGVWAGSDYMGNGSRIFLTTTHAYLVSSDTCPAPPSPYNMTTGYYWLQGANPTVGKLCTGLDVNGDPDPATAAVASATVNGVGPWYTLINPISDTSGQVFANNAYLPYYLAITRAAKAFGIPALGGLRDAAITNANIIATADNHDFSNGISWANDDNLN